MAVIRDWTDEEHVEDCAGEIGETSRPTTTVTVTNLNIREMDSHSRGPDVFDSIISLNEGSIQEGYTDGYNAGLASGKEEGREVGLKNGFEVGEELGFYRGCVNVWESVINVAPHVYSLGIQKSIKQLRELIEKYPLLEPENEQVQEMMKAMRLKFRIISANLGVKLEYDGYPKSSKQDIEDI